MSEVKKRKIYSSSSVNVDYGLIEQLNQIILLFVPKGENTTTANDNINPLLISFIESRNLPKILSIWSYYSSTNDFHNLIDISIKLSKITFQIDQIKSYLSIPIKQLINEFYKQTLNNSQYMKIIYRALNNMKPSITIANIRILINMIKFDPLIIGQEFLNGFDLTLNVLPKLLIPKKYELETEANSLSANESFQSSTIRSNFIRFWFELCSNVSFIHRQDLLLNHRKILNNIWKYLSIDSIELIEFIIDFIDLKIFQELNFKRSIKCKILNENFIYKISILFTKFSNSTNTSKSKFITFIDKLAIDSKYGLSFPNDKLWEKDSNIGVIIEINNKQFKIANKLLYTLVTSLKPNESNDQLQYIIRVLTHNQELIAPYMNWIVQHGGGYHDPSLTSWWITYTLLYSQILQIPPSTGNNSNTTKFDSKLISENIILAPLGKTVLINGLTIIKKPLIIQLTFQLILYILKKLESFLKIVNVKQDLIDLVFTQLPDLNSIIQVINSPTLSGQQLQQHKIIKLTALTIIEKYESLLPSVETTTTTTSNNNMVQKLVSMGISTFTENVDNNLTNYDLILFDLYMKINNNIDSGQDFKWWNKLTNNSNSFFTVLIKFIITTQTIHNNSNSNNSQVIIVKIYQLLNKLCNDKMLFNNQLLVSPIMALIYSLDDNISNNKDANQFLNKIWNMLDETISRVVRTPYKYLDLSHSQYQDTSIFNVALIEQFKFILNKKESFNVDDKDEDDVRYINWLFKFFKYLILIGESKESLLLLVKNQLNIDDHTLEDLGLINSLNFSTTTTTNQDKNNELNLKDSLIMEIIMNCSIDELINKMGLFEKKIISSNLDFLACLLLIDLLIQQPPSQQQQQQGKVKQLIELIFSKIWSFLMNSTINNEVDNDNSDGAIKYFTSIKTWNPFFKSIIKPTNKEIINVVLQLYNEILINLPNITTIDQQFSKFLFEELSQKQNQKSLQSLYQFMWILNNDQLQNLLTICQSNNYNKEDQELFFNVVKTCIDKRLSISFFDFKKIYELNNSDKEEKVLTQRKELLTKLIEFDLIEFDNDNSGEDIQLNSIIDEILSNNNNQDYFLIESMVKKSSNLIVSKLMIKDSQDQNINHLKCLVVYSMAKQKQKQKQKQEQNLNIPQDLLTQVSTIIIDKLQQKDKSNNDVNELNWDQILTILNLQDHISLSLFQSVFQSIELKQTFIPQFLEFIIKFCQSETITTTTTTTNIADVDDDVKIWLHKAMLYITKKFAECKTFQDLMKNQFNQFLYQMSQIFHIINIWNLIPSTIINTQIDVILQSNENWINNHNHNPENPENGVEILKYLIQLIINCDNWKQIDYIKLFQISLNQLNCLNESPNLKNIELKYYSSMILYLLFNFDNHNNSSHNNNNKLSTFMNLQLLLPKYLGTNRPEDLLIKSILIKIESKISTSWMIKVNNWEFQEEEEDDDDSSFNRRLIKVDNGGQLTICLNKKMIKNSLNSIQLSLPNFNDILKSNKSKNNKTTKTMTNLSYDEKWNQIKEFYQISNSILDVNKLAYDHEFLMMVILNNDELLKYHENKLKPEGNNKDENKSTTLKESSINYSFNIKNLIDTGILQVIVISLGDNNNNNESIKKIAQIILGNILQSINCNIEEGDNNNNNNNDINKSFKDKNIYRIYLSTILFTLRNQQTTTIPHLIWYIWSQFIPILSNPGHFLYDKVTRFVLSHPMIKPNQIPLFNSIINHSDKYNESISINSHDNNTNSGGYSYYRELNWLIEIINQGILTQLDLSLICNYDNGIIIEFFINLINLKYLNFKLKSSILKFIYKLQSIDQGSDLLITRFGLLSDLELIIMPQQAQSQSQSKVDEDIIDKQLKINLDELILRFGISVGSSKRVREWIGGDDELGKTLKRIHQESQMS